MLSARCSCSMPPSRERSAANVEIGTYVPGDPVVTPPRAAGRIDRFIVAVRPLVLGVRLATPLVAEQQRRVIADGGQRP